MSTDNLNDGFDDSIDMGDVDPDKIGNFVGAGKFHCAVESVELHRGMFREKDVNGETVMAPQDMEVHFQVLKGAPAGDEGSSFREYFAKTGKGVQRLMMLLDATGLRTLEQQGADRAAGKPPQCDLMQLIGRQVMLERVEESYEKQDGTKVKRTKVAFAIYRVGSKEAKGFPEHPQYAKDWKARMIAEHGQQDDSGGPVPDASSPASESSESSSTDPAYQGL